MSSNMEDLSPTDTSTEETGAAPTVTGDYPKVQAGYEPSQNGAPIGSIPLSVSESDLPHHRAADPTATEDQES